MQLPTIPLYWKCQLIGWSVASFYWGYSAFFGGNFSFSIGLIHFITDVLICILLTHSYRGFALKSNWHTLSLKALVPRMAAAIFVLSLLFMIVIIVKLYLVRLFFYPHFTDTFWAYFKLNRLTVFITGTRLLSIWVLAYHLYHYAQREINIVRENARLSIIAKEAQLSNLSAQLNPHFFFNSLNNIKFLVVENPVAARRAIDLLSDLLRNAFYNKDDKWIAVKTEIGLVKDYLELEKLRFEERLQVSITAADQLSAILIPPFSIQTLVENAIKHGINKSKDGGLIALNVAQQDGFLKISVQNPGQLNAAAQPPGIGLKNLQERLRLQFNGKATLAMEALDGTVLTTILIPVA